ncbi:hypothetical protein D3C72_833720 [compost metagenome]
MQGFPTQAQFFQDTGAEVLDEDVGFTEQFFQDRQAVRVFEVQRQRLFIARLDEPPQRRAFIQFSPLAQWIPAVGRFDLDHFGTELAANARGKRPGNQCTQFNDFHTAERFVGERHTESCRTRLSRYSVLT